MEMIPVEPPASPARPRLWEPVAVAAIALLLVWALARLLGVSFWMVFGFAIFAAAAVVAPAYFVSQRGE